MINKYQMRSPSGGIINRGTYFEGGSFLPSDMDTTEAQQQQQQPTNVEQKPSTTDHKVALLSLIKKIWKQGKVKFAKEDEKLSYPKDAGRLPTTGQSGRHFLDSEGGYFYKQPYIEDHSNLYKDNHPQVYTESAASKAMRMLGVEHVHPVETVEHGGSLFLKSRYLNGLRSLTNHSRDLPDLQHLDISPEQIARHGLGSWLIHAADRHGANYLVDEKNNLLHAIDYGDSWSPHVGYNNKAYVHPEEDDLLNHKFNGLQGKRYRIPEHVLNDFLTKLPQIHKLMHYGTQLLTPEHKAVAEQLFKDKAAILRSIAPGTPLYQLPKFIGHKITDDN